MNFIKKVFDGKIDNSVHLQFQKFSRGIFGNKAVIRAKNSKGKYTINATAEFANELVQDMAKILSEGKSNVTGVIVSTSDLTKEIDFQNKKQFQGVKSYVISKEMCGKEILSLLDKFPRAFFALSFKAGDSEIKIKPKAPKSGKPGTKGGETPKPNFCKLVTTDKNLGESFVFERPEFKEAEIKHTFIIEEIKIPDELKTSKDFVKMREESKRKGRILRESIIDGKEHKTEVEFAA
ncbi:MAG: hypothetical protein AABW50_00120 [Nanoarchaeota archaeon]